MKASDFLVSFLIEKDVTDVFGIPGGVVLHFLDSVGKRTNEITARLNYNEQASALSACGYAQASGKMAVAYATRGPGISNMITGIADSYYDSLPVLFITAHSHFSNQTDMRFEENQEFDIVSMATPITKYAVRVERAEDLLFELEKSYHMAISGRPGPVLIDFLSSVLSADIDIEGQKPFTSDIHNCSDDVSRAVKAIRQEIDISKRPIILVGDGVRQSGSISDVRMLIDKLGVPVLSSRFAQDVVSCKDSYFGYIGSHAMRCSNFILSKCDLIISLGNRLAFNPQSESFGKITQSAKLIRIEIDEAEFQREIPNSVCLPIDLGEISRTLIDDEISWMDKGGWLEVCRKLRDTFQHNDIDHPVEVIASIISEMGSQATIVSDVGNNEFWLSRAYALSGSSARLLFSKSFGTLGCSLPKAIGAYYSSRRGVLCFTGDQGLQMNIQELQVLGREQLPVKIILINNSSSGMIREDQKKRFGSRFVSSTLCSGYSVPDFERVAAAYGIEYNRVNEESGADMFKGILRTDKPALIEVAVDEYSYGIPYLPRGSRPQNLEPGIAPGLFDMFDNM